MIVIGAGAIGSHLLPHLARSTRLSRLTIVDRDTYTAGNLRSQDIGVRDVGRPKAAVQARRLRRINPRLSIVPLRAAIEDLPLGALRAALLVSCLDSRSARMMVNQAAWRLGVPWVDAGIEAGGLLARVRTLMPAPEAACLECGWDQADYDAVEQAYPCAAAASAAVGVAQHAPASGASSSLAALAASLQAIECEKRLAGEETAALAGRDLLIDARHHRQYVTAYRRNPECRMPDHEPWRIAPLAGCADATLGEVLAIGSTLRDAGDGLWFGIAGQRFATELHCASCGATRPTLRSERDIRATRPRCRHCGGALAATGMGLHNFVAADRVRPDTRDRRLAELGLRRHDVLTLRTPALAAHFELG